MRPTFLRCVGRADGRRGTAPPRSFPASPAPPSSPRLSLLSLLLLRPALRSELPTTLAVLSPFLASPSALTVSLSQSFPGWTDGARSNVPKRVGGESLGGAVSCSCHRLALVASRCLPRALKMCVCVCVRVRVRDCVRACVFARERVCV